MPATRATSPLFAGALLNRSSLNTLAPQCRVGTRAAVLRCAALRARAPPAAQEAAGHGQSARRGLPWAG